MTCVLAASNRPRRPRRIFVDLQEIRPREVDVSLALRHRGERGVEVLDCHVELHTLALQRDQACRVLQRGLGDVPLEQRLQPQGLASLRDLLGGVNQLHSALGVCKRDQRVGVSAYAPRLPPDVVEVLPVLGVGLVLGREVDRNP